MNPEDTTRLGRALELLSATFDKPLPPLKLEAYARALADLPITEIEAVVDELLATARFMPTPVEIRDAVAGTVADAAESAWVELHELVRAHGYMRAPESWPDPLTKAAAYDIYGTWARLCASLPAPAAGAAYANAAKEFKERYTALARAEDRAERARLREAPRRKIGDGEEGA